MSRAGEKGAAQRARARARVRVCASVCLCVKGEPEEEKSPRRRRSRRTAAAAGSQRSLERGRRSAGKAWGPGGRGVCEGRRRGRPGGGGRERGRWGARGSPGGCGGEAAVVRAARLHWLPRRSLPPGRQALAASDAPARPGKEEGGAARSARAPPTTQAAGISGPGARHSAPLRRPRGAPKGVAPRHGAPDLGVRRGYTSWIDRRRARESPPVLRVERSRRFPFSLPHSKKAAGGFPRAFPPARWGARASSGSAHVGGRGLAPTHTQRPPPSPAPLSRLPRLYGNF